MHITLTGNLGSGKSTICKIINKKYNMEIYSTGKIQREIAESKGMTILEFNELMMNDSSYDKVLDDKVTEVATNRINDDLIFDSRLAWRFVPISFKVFLITDIDESAKRVFNDMKRGDVESYSSLEDAKKDLISRAKVEDERYKKIYGIHYFDYNNYNLIVDTTNCNPEDAANMIYQEASEYYEELKKNPNYKEHKFIISPKTLNYISLDDVESKTLNENIDKYYIETQVGVVKYNNKFYAYENLDELKYSRDKKNWIRANLLNNSEENDIDKKYIDYIYEKIIIKNN